jgi:hypothetical protein
MAKMMYLILPCEGDPLSRVWLPPNKLLGGLALNPSLSEGIELTTYRKMKHFGLAGARPVEVGTFRAGRTNIHAQMVWVKPGQRPTELVGVKIGDALQRHEELGPVIDAILKSQVEARGM